jgi:hypothetical protein
VFLAEAEALRASGCLEAIDQAIAASHLAIMIRVNRTTTWALKIRQAAGAVMRGASSSAFHNQAADLVSKVRLR